MVQGDSRWRRKRSAFPCSMPTTTSTRPRVADQVPPRALQGGHRLRRGAGPHQDRGAGPDQRVHPQPDLRGGGPARRPGGATSASATPTGRAGGRSSASRCGAIPAFREPARPAGADGRAGHRPGPDVPHAGQPGRGADAGRSRPDPCRHPRPQRVAATRRGPFDYEGRIFTTPVITLPIVERAIEELEWVLERGAQGRPHPAGPRPRLSAGPGPSAWRSSIPSGRRWSRTTSWWPCTPRTAATSATPTTGWAATARCCPFQPQAFRMLCRPGGRSRTPSRRWSATARCPASPRSRWR